MSDSESDNQIQRKTAEPDSDVDPEELRTFLIHNYKMAKAQQQSNVSNVNEPAKKKRNMSANQLENLKRGREARQKKAQEREQEKKMLEELKRMELEKKITRKVKKDMKETNQRHEVERIKKKVIEDDSSEAEEPKAQKTTRIRDATPVPKPAPTAGAPTIPLWRQLRL